MGDLTTLRGTPAYGAAKFGNGLSGGVLKAATSTEWDAPVGTVELWVKTTATAVKVAMGNNNTASNGLWIGINSGGFAAFASTWSVNIATSSVNIADGAWHHLAYVCDGTNERFYVDGVQAFTRAGSSLTLKFGSGTSAIGGFGADAGYDWPGQVDEVRISSTVRYSANFTPPTGPFSTDSSTKALYHLESSGQDAAALGIAPDSAGIVYSPYTWDVTSSRAKTITPGAYFRFAVNSSTVTLNFDTTAVSSPVPQLKYRVDGGGWITTSLAASVPLTMPTDNAWTTHVVEVVVKSTSEFVTRWSTQNAHVSLTGIVASGALVTAEAASLRVLVFGDSITEGYKSLSNGTTPTESDSTVGWAFQLGRLLGAEVGTVGYGGIGWLVAGQGGVPALPSSYNLLWGSGPSRSLSSPAPDVIVINCGENDTASVTSAATSFLNSLLSASPATTRIVVLRPFSGAHASELSAAVTAVANSRVTYVDTTGWFSSSDSSDGQHPYGYTSIARLGPRVASAVRSALARGATWVNVGGVAKAASIIRR